MLLEFEKAQKLLEKYKIPVIETKMVNNLQEVLNFLKKRGVPVVLKIESTKILHKTDIGGVITDISNKKELIQNWEKIKKLAQKYKAKILIQKQITGYEVIIGAKQNPVFGPVIMFGLGGIFVEVFKDVSFRLAPITKKETQEMIKEIKGYKILKGYRGKKAINLKQIENILFNLSKLITKNHQIQEVDLNPVIVNEKQAQVVDVKIIVSNK
ncbi:acetate--CoA ligase family protein [bacterium]|nr:acetate--CoA ligase family protein [bacterium]